MKHTWKWGIIGPGKIAHKFAEGIISVPNAQIYAVASSSAERATRFAQEYHVPKIYDSYVELVRDSEVDVVYIASTNNFHYEQAVLCLENNKPCLCEKPFTLNSSQLAHLVNLAEKQQVFLMEALWTMFLPSIATVTDIITSGKIGKIQSMQVDFGFHVPYDEQSRLFSPQLGGGALLDIGLYPIFLALYILGEPLSVHAHIKKTELGVDVDDQIEFVYESGVKATLRASFLENLPCEAIIRGSIGSIVMKRMWHCPTKIELHIDNTILDVSPQYIGNGYNYEIVEVQNCLANNLMQSSKMSLSFSTLLMRYLDKIYALCI